MNLTRSGFLVLAIVGTLACGARLVAQVRDVAFDHLKHAGLFPRCAACHVGAEDPDAEMWPAPTACASCHDGVIQPRVTWQPPTAPHPSNLKFVHDLVPLMTRVTPRGPEPLGCRDCHVPAGAPAMAVRRAQPEVCVQCHAPGAGHLSAPDSVCATCHLPLVRAVTLRREDIARFPAPPSHRSSNFVTREGHGRLAAGGAQSCAVCHARDFCMTCHVDAPEQRAIQQLEPDARARAISVRLAAPASHRDPSFLQRHGAMVRADARQCSTCHTQESCLACHAPSQRVGQALHSTAPERGAGAQPRRGVPASHRENFARRHSTVASATPATCAGCHVRTDCIQCHRPNAAAGPPPGYHPAGFLTRHPAAAYARESRCSDCHNVNSFCQACHASAGLSAGRALGSGYHDGSRTFIAGHGQAARQSLESCTACHAERDCLPCHAAIGGRHFNPHGPGFDAERMRRKNPQMCTVCHGAAIPQR
jgi:predicted CXXCH cytochrome family protein